MDGEGRSWTFLVYIISNELADRFPGDEDELPPNDGNPHPFNREVYPGEPNWVQQWVNDQMLHAGFHNGQVVEQAIPVQHEHINPMDDLPQWEQWPNHNNNVQHMAQLQEELSVEVSGLSVGLNSGSTAVSGSNTSGIALAPAAQLNTITIVPRALSPHNLPRPPIKLVYSPRQRNMVNENHTRDMATSTTPSVGMDRLMADAQAINQLVPSQANVGVDEEDAN
ncbi:hypothetical protein GUJ93_ZPchr0009g672 [Zizania palustris]|uniref:Uncharacterized protein n=1 Tax=Zizania palustris TaxID=103762 RepID=A0A8J5S718_ZIZPA|nr:hypothetical protein GUJ93_ZPchr0009g672 [Zizania palustris]